MVESWGQTGTSLIGRPGSLPSRQTRSILLPPSPAKDKRYPQPHPTTGHQRHISLDSRVSPTDLTGEENLGKKIIYIYICIHKIHLYTQSIHTKYIYFVYTKIADIYKYMYIYIFLLVTLIIQDL